MADQPKTPDAKTLEMRVAELEDKLSKIHVTEDEVKAFQKVSSLMGTQPAAASEAPLPCVASNCIVSRCNIIHQCFIIQHCGYPTSARFCTIIRQCGCINECGGGCLPGGGVAGGGGFSGLGG